MIYANDNDKAIAGWLGKLPLDIDFIDTRSIKEVSADDVRKYTQCHFFAGIGGWPLALRMAKWPDDIPVWSGSCPCQPFSAAGKRGGTSDERHLWPEFRRLIAEAKPPAIFGEQVASKAGREWLSSVRSEMEELGYEFGAADLCAAGIGSPHIRQRLFWVAYSNNWGFQKHSKRNGPNEGQVIQSSLGNNINGRSNTFGLADTTGERSQGSERSGECVDAQFATAQRSGEASWMGDASVATSERNARDVSPKEEECSGARIEDGDKRFGSANASETQWMGNSASERPLPGALNGVHRIEKSSGPRNGQPERSSSDTWSDVEFIYCRDDKWRPVKSSICPLVNGVSAILADGTTYGKKDLSRVVALHGIGNAIVPQVAAVFIKTVMEYLEVE